MKKTVSDYNIWNVVWRRLLRDPWAAKRLNSKGNQSWIFIGRTDAEPEVAVLWPPDAKNWITGKDPDAGKDWRQEEKGMTEDEIVGWHHWLYGHEFEQAPGDGDGQGRLACCSPRGCKELDMTEWLNNSNLLLYIHNSIFLPLPKVNHVSPLVFNFFFTNENLKEFYSYEFSGRQLF